MDDIRAYFDQRRGEMLDLLQQLVEIESPSTEKAATDRIVRFVTQVAQEAGADVTVVPQEAYGDHLLAKWGAGGGGFLLLCHLDTVWPVGTLAERPWHVEGERAIGPGSMDNKGSAAIILSVMRGLQDLGRTPCRPVTMLFNTDEEVGSHSSRALIEREAQRAGVVFCIEPALPDGSLKVWRKGTGAYTITARGRAAHAGADHAKGINAITELAHQILLLQAMTDYEVGTTVSTGVVSGGTRSNVVPDWAEVVVDLRVRTIAEGQRIVAVIEGLQPVLTGAHLEIEGSLNRPPMEKSLLTMEPFRRAQAIGSQLGLTLQPGGTGGGADANFAAALGVPTLDGLGAIGDCEHSVDEYILIPSLAERAALMATLLLYWDDEVE